MTKIVWSGAQDTNWFNPNNWNPAIVPGQGVQVVIPAGLANYPVIPDGDSVSLNQGLSLGGNLTLASTGDNTNLIFNGGGTFSLSGGGAIVMSDSGANRIYSTQSGTVLDNADSIQGAGQIYSNGGSLSIINEAGGIVNANAAINALNISSLSLTNKGLIEATSTGGLDLSSVTLDQSSGTGTLSAAGGNVYLSTTTVLGGTLKTTGSALIETNGNGSVLNGGSGHAVTISTGSTVQVSDGQNLTIVGVINDSGTILLDSGANGVNFDDTDLIVNGGTTVKLQGAGTLRLSDSPTNRIYSTNGGTILENVNDTIAGAGQIYANSDLSLLNDASGIINASAANNDLNINNISLTNNGLVEATSTGGLDLAYVTLDQSGGAGALSAAGGNVYLNNVAILGGTVETTGSALVETNGNGSVLNGSAAHAVAISTGSTVQINDGQNLAIVGVINNAGTILLDSGEDGVHFDDTDLIVTGGATVKLQGGGTLRLSDSGVNRLYGAQSGTILENVDDAITGAGQIYSNGSLSLINDASGVINASAANNALNINSIYLTNNGLVESTSAGGLDLSSMTIDQSTGSGALSAAGGNVYLNVTTILGGTLKTAGSALIETSGNSSVLNGASSHAVTVSSGSTVQVSDGQNLTIVGVINDAGAILLDSGEDGVHFDNTDLIVTGGTTVKLQGGGTLQLSNSGANRLYGVQSGTVLENVDDAITGAGQIYSNGNLTLQNDASGTINASAANQLNIGSITVNNAGVLEATSTGGLQLSSVTLNNTGALEAAGGNVYLSVSTVSGGTLSTTGTSKILTDGNSSTLSGVSIAAGAGVYVSDGNNLSLTGTVTNAGTLYVNSGQDGVHFDNTDLLIQGANTVTLTGGGTIQLVTGGANRLYSTQGNTVLDNINNKIQGSGQILSNGALSITNEASGVIAASNTGQTLSISSIPVTNKGTITTKTDGTLTLNSMTLSQSGAGTLSAAQGNIYFNNSHIVSGSISTSGPYVVATNGNSTLLDGSSAALTITSGSTVQVSDGQNLSLTGTIAGAGTIFVDSGEDGVHLDYTDLLINGATNLTGGGRILLSNASTNRIYSNVAGTVLTNTSDTIVGGGQIYSNGDLSITNAAGGTIEAGPGETLTVNLSLNNAGVLEGNGGALNVLGPVTGAGTVMVTNGGSVRFGASSAFANVVYSGPNAGLVQILSGAVPTITGFAANDSFYAYFDQNITSLGFVENSGNASGVLTFYSGASAIANYTLNGFYTSNDFALVGGGPGAGYYGALGVGDVWSGGAANWATAGDWSQGLPGADDDVVINAGSPNVAASIGTIRSLSVTGAGSVNFGSIGGNVVSGAIYDSSLVSLDAVAGQGGANLSAGTVDVVAGGVLSLGDSTLSANDQLTAGAIVNAGSINLVGSATKQALLNDTGAAGFGTAKVLTGAVSLAGDSAIEFASGSLQQIAAGASLTENGPSAFVEIAGKLGSNSALTTLTSIAGALSLENAATIVPTGTIYNSGAFNIDDLSQAGGTTETLLTLINTGVLDIGNAAMTVADQLKVGTLRNTGAININGGATAQALLYVTGAGVTLDSSPGVLYGSVSLSGSSALKFASGAVTTIASGASLRLQGKKAFVEDAASLNSDSALTTLATVSGSLLLENGAAFVDTSGISDAGSLSLDTNAGDGGAALTLGALNVTGALAIGNSTLSANTTLKASALANTGSITLIGSASFQALLNVAGTARFGTTSTLTGAVNLAGKSAIAFASGGIVGIASASSLRLAGASAFIENATLGANSALKTLATVAGALTLDSNVTIADTVALTNSGTIAIDAIAGEGGSNLTTSSSLANSGTLTLGDTTLSAADAVNAHSLANTGAIAVIGGAATQALINVGSAASFGTAGVVSGAVSLAGDAAIEFTSGTFTTIASGASLTLSGAKAFIEDSGALNQNSALTTLATDSGILSVHNSVQISSSRALAVSAGAQLNVDASNGDGGSQLIFAGGLTNASAVVVGNASLSGDDLLQASTLTNTASISLTGASSTQARLNVTHAAAFGAGTLVTGSVSLLGDSALEFASGTLTGVASGASLILNGTNAYVEDSTSLGSNSALSGLAAIAGIFDLFNGGTVASGSAIANSGQINVSTTTGSHLDDSLSTTAALKNTGSLSATTSANAGADITITAASLTNSGSISLANGGGLLADNVHTAATLLNVTAGTAGFGTAGSLTGNVYIGLDSAIEFATGFITQIAATGVLELGASNSYLEDSGTLGANSALNALANVAGTLRIDNGSVISSTSALTNSGTINIDVASGGGGGGLTTTGLLTNTGALNVGSGGGLTAAANVSAASLSNSGSITLSGGGATQAALTITGSAGFGTAGVFKGVASLFNDAAITFGGGAITSVASGSTLRLDGAQAGVDLSTGGGVNAALGTLTQIAGVVDLENSDTLSDSAALTISGGLFLDSFSGDGGAGLSDSNAINVTGTLNIGNAGSSAVSTVTTPSLTNSGSINLLGNGSNHFAQLSVTGTMTNNGAVFAISDTETLSGTVAGTGTFDIWNGATLDFGGVVGTGQTVTFDNNGTLGANATNNEFQATIAGFGANDAIQLLNFGGAGSNWSFSENNSNTAGTLTITNNSTSTQLTFAGLYSTGSFNVAGTASAATITFL